MPEVCVGIAAHHLFDHKPDSLLSKGTKYKLHGFYRFGTPGVAVVWGEQHDIDCYVDSLKSAMPQKKFEIRFQKHLSAGERSPKDWIEVDLGGLREALTRLGLEDAFFAVTGLDPSKATDPNVTKTKGGKQTTGKRQSKK